MAGQSAPTAGAALDAAEVPREARAALEEEADSLIASHGGDAEAALASRGVTVVRDETGALGSGCSSWAGRVVMTIANTPASASAAFT